MELFEVMRTTFAAREFTDEAVPDDVVYRILDNARFAPSGGNRQGWQVLVIREQDTRDALVPLIRPAMKRYVSQVRAGEAPWNTINDTKLDAAEIEQLDIPDRAIHWLTNAPVVLLVFVDLSVVASFDRDLDRVGVISGASVYPFVHNILLSARHEGFGGVPTTFLGACEPQVQELLGVPEHVAFAAMIPIGRPVKQLTRLKRGAVEGFARNERWDGPALSSGDAQ